MVGDRIFSKRVNVEIDHGETDDESGKAPAAKAAGVTRRGERGAV
jgi:hypothetical protein